MAQLPPDGEWLIQQIDAQVILFKRGNGEEEIVRFDPRDPFSFGPAQEVIHESELLTPEQKSWAHFWSGYFYAAAVDR